MRSQSEYRLPLMLAVVLAIMVAHANGVAAQGVGAGTTDCNAAGWPTAILSHPEVARLGVSAPGTSSIGSLGLLTPPADESPAVPVIWRVDARITSTQLAPDGTTTVALTDPTNPSQTMVAVFLSSGCVASADPVLAQQLDAARAALNQACGTPTPFPQPCATNASVIGAGVFKSDSTPSSAGEAANGLELRPVLALQSTPSSAGVMAPGPPSTFSMPGPVSAGASLAKDLSGIGPQDSQPFLLGPGAYTLTWSASAPGSAPVNFAGFLKPVDPTLPGWIFVANSIVRPGYNQSGSVQSPTIGGGAYYLTSIGDAAWTLRIAPAPAATSMASGTFAPTAASGTFPPTAASGTFPSTAAAGQASVPSLNAPPLAPDRLPPGVVVRNRPTPRPRPVRPRPTPGPPPP